MHHTPFGPSHLLPLAAILCVGACGDGASTAGGDDAGVTPADGAAEMPDGALGDAAANEASVPTPDGGPPAITATLRTVGTCQYVSALNGGGSSVNAAAGTAGPNETFTLTDLNGGDLVDGDAVLVAAHGGQYLSAANGGGGALTADATTAADNETFVVTRLDGPGKVAAGDHVAFKTKTKTNYVSAINGGGGEVRADAPWARGWETFSIAFGSTPTASPKQKVLDFITCTSGKKTITGQHNKFNSSPSVSTDWIKTDTGKTPGLWSADFGFGADSVNNRALMISEAKTQWHAGAIVQLMYHNCIPTRDELCDWDSIGGSSPQHLTDAQWSDLVTEGTSLNSAWKARLDTLSVFFADLKAAGVAPLFRPLHEMNQSVFWWGGRGGANGTRKLFQITHDYLVTTKGFDNIIWVWDLQDFGSLATDVSDYDPGPAYYDIAALDVYGGGYDTAKYTTMLGVAGSKPIAIGECEHPPTSAILTQQPRWAFFMLWPDFLDENASTLPALYNAPNVVNEDGMPGW
jgi:hypothetical protein